MTKDNQPENLQDMSENEIAGRFLAAMRGALSIEEEMVSKATIDDDAHARYMSASKQAVAFAGEMLRRNRGQERVTTSSGVASVDAILTCMMIEDGALSQKEVSVGALVETCANTAAANCVAASGVDASWRERANRREDRRSCFRNS